MRPDRRSAWHWSQLGALRSDLIGVICVWCLVSFGHAWRVAQLREGAVLKLLNWLDFPGATLSLIALIICATAGQRPQLTRAEQMTAGGCNASKPLLLRNNSVRYPHEKAQGLSQAKFIEEAYSKREPVQNPKLRYFKPFEFFEHTGSPTAQSPTDARCFAFIGVAFRTTKQVSGLQNRTFEDSLHTLGKWFPAGGSTFLEKGSTLQLFQRDVPLRVGVSSVLRGRDFNSILGIKYARWLLAGYWSDTSIPMALMPTGNLELDRSSPVARARCSCRAASDASKKRKSPSRALRNSGGYNSLCFPANLLFEKLCLLALR